MSSTIFAKLSEAQRKQHKRAKLNGSDWVLKLSRKQVLSTSSEYTELTPDHLPLNKGQTKEFLLAVMKRRPVDLTFSTKTVKRGGFFFAIIPALAALAPGLLGALPQLAKGVKEGYETVGKLAGVKIGSAVETPTAEAVSAELDRIIEGSSLQQFSSGASLKMFGEGLKPKRQKKPVSPIA